MMRKLFVNEFLTVVLLSVSAALSAPSDGDVFAVPEILKGNVAFWRKIYTEVSLKGGLIHDRDYPLVIFENVTSGASQAAIRQRKESISATLKSMAAQPESTWGAVEKSFADLYRTQASTEALTGADERVRFQQGQMERFREGLERSGMYIDTIRAILRRYDVPARLAYLPHVESSFNTHAYSKVGAAGLWQFMRGTGKLYGMRIDYTIDERRDPFIATEAAAKYLSASYRELKSWPLAITSYNHGLYGMKRAVAKTGSSDLAVIIQNYSSPSFRFASSNFYGCFLAASEIAENHATHFPSLTLHAPVRVADVALDYYIGPDVLVKHLNISRERLIELNPAVRPAVFEQHKKLPKGYVLHVPAELDIATARLAIAAIPDSLKSSEPERPLYYRVARGDNLYAIASRLGVSVRDIAAENNITKLSRIRAGQVLRVPGAAPARKPVAVASASVPQPPETTVVATAAPEPPAPSPASPTPTEAVAEIAMAEAQLSEPPHPANESLKQPEPAAVVPLPPGPKPVVNTAGRPSQARPETGAAVPLPQRPPEPKPEVLADSLREIAFAPAIVERETPPTQRPAISANFDVALYNLDVVLSSVGTSAEIWVSVDETIGHYADWLGVPTWRIRKLNEMGSTSDIRLNRKLLIPIDGQESLDRFVAARLEYHMALEEDFHSQYKVAELKPYQLRRGETLWHICNGGESPIPMWLLKKYNNHLDLGRLMPQTEIWIPVIEELTEKDLAARSLQPVREEPAVRQPNPLRSGLGSFQRVP